MELLGAAETPDVAPTEAWTMDTHTGLFLSPKGLVGGGRL